MTATPFSVSPIVHKMGIGPYFFGVVVLQAMIFINEYFGYGLFVGRKE